MRWAVLFSFAAVALVIAMQGVLLWRVIELDRKAEQLPARVHAALEKIHADLKEVRP